MSLFSGLVLPVRVGAQYGDSHHKVHHDREQDHAEAQQYGSVLPCSKRCYGLPLVQDLIFSKPLVDGSEKRGTDCIYKNSVDKGTEMLIVNLILLHLREREILSLAVNFFLRPVLNSSLLYCEHLNTETN